MNKYSVLVKICTSGSDTLFHSSYDCVITRKMFLIQSHLHWPKQMEIRRHQILIIQWMWLDRPVKTGNMLNGLQTGTGPGIIVLQETVFSHTESQNGPGWKGPRGS